MIPILLAALALAGAPASTPVSCTQAVPQAEYGWAYWAPAPSIVLSTDTCAGLRWLQGGHVERWLMQRRKPFVAWPGQAGVSALVMLHESSHIAGVHDETDAECRALGLLPTLLGRYLAGPQLVQAIGSAAAYDRFLPGVYHRHGC